MTGSTFAYIAGPMRGIEAYNFPEFFAAEKQLLSLGLSVFNPARNDVNTYGLGEMLDADPTGRSAGQWLLDNPQGFDLRHALADDLQFITLTADMLVVLPGWEKSKGARAEVATARALGIPVHEFHVDSGHLHTTTPEHDPAVDMWTESFTVRQHPLPVTPAPWPTYANNEVPEDGLTGKDEVRTTSATGGQKGVKLAAFDQISPEIEMLVAEHFGKGARKYSAHNFRNGYEWSKSYSALRRHLAAFWGGEEYDDHLPSCPEGCTDHTGSLHIVAVIWHAMVLTEFYLHRKEYDDRFIYPELPATP